MPQTPDLSWHLRLHTGWREWRCEFCGQTLRVTERRNGTKAKVVGLLGDMVIVRGHDVATVQRQLAEQVIERMSHT